MKLIEKYVYCIYMEALFCDSSDLVQGIFSSEENAKLELERVSKVYPKCSFYIEKVELDCEIN